MSICDDCIHDYVCGLEDNHEEGIVSCADMIPKDVLDKIRAEVQENINYNKKMDYQGIVAGLLLALNIIESARQKVRNKK